MANIQVQTLGQRQSVFKVIYGSQAQYCFQICVDSVLTVSYLEDDLYFLLGLQKAHEALQTGNVPLVLESSC